MSNQVASPDVITNNMPPVTDTMGKMPTMNTHKNGAAGASVSGSQRPRSKASMSGLSAAGQAVISNNNGGSHHYQGGALGLQNKAAYHQDPTAGSGKDATLSQKYNSVNVNEIVEQSREKNYIMRKPAKQGRMFGLSLGQDVSFKIGILNFNYLNDDK